MSRLFIAKLDNLPIDAYGLFYNDEAGVRQAYKENFKELVYDTHKKAYAKLESLINERYYEDDAVPYTMEDAKTFIKNRHWKFAKTYAKTDPHDYVLKEAIPIPYKDEFYRFIATIRANSVTLHKKDHEECIMVCGDYYYWFERQMDKVAAHLIKRAKMEYLSSKDGAYYYNEDIVREDIKKWEEEQTRQKQQRKLEEQKRMRDIRAASKARDGVEFKYDESGYLESYKDGKFSGYIIDSSTIHFHERDIVRPGTVVQHFKRKIDDSGNNYLYKVIGKSLHADTDEELVVYQALYADKKIYVRPLTDFAGLVDREKYPDIRQPFRFEIYRDKVQNLRFDSLTCFIDKVQAEAYGTMTGFQKSGDHLMMPFATYSKPLHELEEATHKFVDDHSEYGLKDYKTILEKHNLIPVDGKEDIESMDAQCVLALLFGAFRAERFCDGALLGFCQSGELVRCLKRLKALDESSLNDESYASDLESSDSFKNLEYLRVKISGFSFGYDSWEIKKENELYRIDKEYCHLKEESGTKLYTALDVSLDQWLSELKLLRIDIWDNEYVDSDILDGTQWKLSYKIAGKDPIIIRGSNKFPRNWKELTALLDKLEAIMRDAGGEMTRLLD